MPTILLVEDDPAIRRAIEDHLTRTGYSVIAEQSPAAALDKVSGEHGIDLLLVDLVMPPDQPDEAAFATKLKTAAPGVPALFMTGYHGLAAPTSQRNGIAERPLDLERLTREIEQRLAG